MRVLVTGGAGFIGSHIVDLLIGEGNDVLVVDNMSVGNESNLPAEVRLVELDIGDPALLRLASSFKPHVITHCAAQTGVPASMADPKLDAATNIMGGLNVSEAAIASECTQIIYINTGGALYGTPDYLPCDEDHPIRPISPYGLSKWTLECYLRMLVPDSVPLQVLRLSNVYGPRQDPLGEAGVVAMFGRGLLTGEQVTIFGDGEQTRDFIYVGDVARAHQLALERPEQVTANISSEKATSVNELFRLMATEVGNKRSPVYKPERPGEVKHVVLANGKAEAVLGWMPEIPLQEGLRATTDWIRTQVAR